MADTAIMVDEIEGEREIELRSKRICRFCMSTEEPLTDLYSQENRLKTRVPLPLQIMSCVSIEVFTNDGMPRTVCDSCRLLMDFNYRFKQMCKKSELLLRQYPLTGVWAPKIPLPTYPQELIVSRPILTPIKRKVVPKPTIKPNIESQVDDAEVEEPPQKRQALTKPLNDVHQIKATNQLTLLTGDVKTVKPRILNKPAKVLNSGASTVQHRSPDFKTKEDGGIELVFEATETGVVDAMSSDIFPCTECDRTFPLRQLLEMHMVKHNRDRTFECEFCEKKFFSKYDLSKHMLTHAYVKPFQCSVCKASFARSTQLSRHEKSHSDHPQFLCSFCDKSFLNMTDLERHEENHRKNRPFQCRHCDKSFAFKQGLERHEVVHSTDQPFKCQYCDITVSTSSKLTRHLADEHAGGRPYPCRMCPKSYLLSHHLTRHIRSHKNSQSIYICNDCPEQFNSMGSLIEHSQIHARERLACPMCKEQFNSFEEVSEHIDTHIGEQFACEFCDLIFTREDQKDEHCETEHSAEQAEYNADNETRHVKPEVHDEESGSNENEMIVGEEPNLTEIPKRGRPRKSQTNQPTILNYVKPSKQSIKPEVGAQVQNMDIDESITQPEADLEHDIENMEFDIIDFDTSGDFALKLSSNRKATPKSQPVVKKESPHQKPSTIQKSPNQRKTPISPATKTSPIKQVPVAQQKLEQQLQQAMKSPPKPPGQVAAKPTAVAATPGKPVLTKVNMKKLPAGVTVKKIAPEVTPSTRIATPANAATPKRPVTQYGVRPNPTPSKTPKDAAKPIVQRVKMTQAQVDAMAKEGKIQVRNGQVFLRSTK